MLHTIAVLKLMLHAWITVLRLKSAHNQNPMTWWTRNCPINSGALVSSVNTSESAASAFCQFFLLLSDSVFCSNFCRIHVWFSSCGWSLTTRLSQLWLRSGFNFRRAFLVGDRRLLAAVQQARTKNPTFQYSYVYFNYVAFSESRSPGVAGWMDTSSNSEINKSWCIRMCFLLFADCTI